MTQKVRQGDTTTELDRYREPDRNNVGSKQNIKINPGAEQM